MRTAQITVTFDVEIDGPLTLKQADNLFTNKFDFNGGMDTDDESAGIYIRAWKFGTMKYKRENEK